MTFRSDFKATVAPAIFAALGEPATYTPAGGAAKSCTVILTEGVQLQPVGVESQVWQRGTTIDALLAEIGSTPARGDVFTVAGTTYTVQAILDDDGMTIKAVVT